MLALIKKLKACIIDKGAMTIMGVRHGSVPFPRTVLHDIHLLTPPPPPLSESIERGDEYYEPSQDKRAICYQTEVLLGSGFRDFFVACPGFRYLIK